MCVRNKFYMMLKLALETCHMLSPFSLVVMRDAKFIHPSIQPSIHPVELVAVAAPQGCPILARRAAGSCHVTGRVGQGSPSG